MNEFDFVATGDVGSGEYMRRHQAEAEGLPYRELTSAESEQVDEQEGVA